MRYVLARRRSRWGLRIVFERTLADLVSKQSTLTGEHLSSYVGA